MSTSPAPALDGPLPGPALPRRAADLMQPAPAVPPEGTSAAVRDLFASAPEQGFVVVVDGGVPLGVLLRNAFMEAWARPFTPQLFGRKSCTRFMRPPLVVDAATPIPEIARAAVARGADVLEQGFVVTEAGRYAGVGRGAALVAALAEIEAERARHVEESVRYASTIQRAMLAPSATLLAAALPDSALVWEPRDLVGGDTYCFRDVPSGLAGAVLDCTGHGVPGAFMTCLAYSALDRAFSDAEVAADPSRVLAHLDARLKTTLRHGPAEASADDGLDGLVFHLSRDRAELRVASARVPCLVRSRSEVRELPCDRTSVGNALTPDDHTWPAVAIGLDPEALVLVATDGFTDQPGGPRGVAFGRRRLAELLATTAGATAVDTAAAVREAHRAWENGGRRRDDATLLAFSTRSAP